MQKPYNVSDDKINTLFNILFNQAQDKNFKLFKNKTDKEILSVLENGNVGFNKTDDNFYLCVNNNGVLKKIAFVQSQPQPQTQQEIGITPYALNNLVQGSKANITGGFSYPILVIIHAGSNDGGARLWISDSNNFGNYDSSYDGSYSNAKKIFSYCNNDSGEGAGAFILAPGMYFSATGRHMDGVWYAPLYAENS